MQKNIVVTLLLGITFLLIFDMSSSFAVSDNTNSWNIYKLSGSFITPDNKGVSHQIFNIPYQIHGGEIEKIQVDQEAMSFLVTIKGNRGDEIKIIIPRNLLDVKSMDGGDEKFFVLVDGMEEASYDEIKNQCYRNLSIPFHKDSKTIEIIGDNTNLSLPKKSEIQPLYIETNKDHYSSGETIIIEGCTSLDIDKGNVTINVTDPSGKTYKAFPITPKIDGTFSTIFVIDDKSNQTGNYTVTATYGNYTAVPEFPIVAIMLLVSMSTVVLSVKFRSSLFL